MEYPQYFNPVIASNFEAQLQQFKDKPNLTFLQIGVYRGDVSVWLLDNILTDTSSRLVDVDIWERRSRWPGVDEDLYNLKINSYLNVVKFKGTSTRFFEQTTDFFDFIYVDGEYGNKQTYKDCIDSLKRLKTDGLLVIDDYLREDGSPAARYKDIVQTIQDNKDNFRFEELAGQMWVKHLP